jgi:putative oxidoreductase
MHRILGGYAEPLWAVLRIVASFLFACHGAQKLFGVFGGVSGQGDTVPLLSQLGLAGLIELVGGTLVAVGLLGSSAAFLASGEMAVAYFTAHQPRGLLPIQNGGELAALYAFFFLYVAARGSGRWSLANALGRPDLA